MVTTRAPKTSEDGWPPSLWPALSVLIGESWPPVSDAAVAAFVRGAETNRLLAIAAADGSLPAAVRSWVAERFEELAPAQALVDRDTDDLVARLPTLIAGAVQIWRKLSLLDSPGIHVRFPVALTGQMARR